MKRISALVLAEEPRLFRSLASQTHELIRDMSPDTSARDERIRQACWNAALHALGTSYVFQEQAKKYKKIIRIISVLGLAVPLLIGATVGSYGKDSLVSGIAIAITAPIAIAQTVLSGISLVYKWDDSFSYALESLSDNRIISNEYKSLAEFPPEDLVNQYALLNTRDNARTAQDEKVSISEKEKRAGMRYALLIFRRKCETCQAIPNSMAATNCDTCGNF